MVKLRTLDPPRVHQTVTRLLQNHNLKGDPSVTPVKTPVWYNTIGNIPPAAILVRTQPLKTSDAPRKNRTKKPSKLFKPSLFEFEEDKLRQNFYKEHPWELARPRIIMELDGKDGQSCDWSKIQQKGRQLNAESVVQRQLWLLHNGGEGMTSKKAYDQARREFYDIRYEQEVERRVAKEEAEMTGARFDKSRIEISQDIEDKMYGDWKKWALEEISLMNTQRAAAYTGPVDVVELAGQEEASILGTEPLPTTI